MVAAASSRQPFWLTKTKTQGHSLCLRLIFLSSRLESRQALVEVPETPRHQRSAAHTSPEPRRRHIDVRIRMSNGAGRGRVWRRRPEVPAPWAAAAIARVAGSDSPRPRPSPPHSSPNGAAIDVEKKWAEKKPWESVAAETGKKTIPEDRFFVSGLEKWAKIKLN